MTLLVPPISKYMSARPVTIARDQTLAAAMKLMDELRGRHLPVVDAGQLVGVISERDVALALALSHARASALIVEDAMSHDPYTVAPSASLEEVTRTMADKRYGSAVVVEAGKVVGIFTAVDALAAIADLLHAARTR